MLEKLLQSKDNGERQVVFLDELPWLDTPGSGFITAFEGFWNTWACHRSNIMVVVCGSANSWILDKLIDNHGGLYNRVTHEIKLEPFTLAECKEFFKSNNLVISDYDISFYYSIGSDQHVISDVCVFTDYYIVSGSEIVSYDHVIVDYGV